MLSDDLGERYFLLKVPKFWHVVFNVVEEYCCVFLLLVFVSFSGYKYAKNGFS